MKYIRTKDHWVCKVKNEDERTISYENSWESGCLWKESYKDKMQYADTIEELCDEFVIVGTNWQQIIDLESARYNLKRPKELKVFGAIWTDKGLIYVAKMNDKGELELL